MLERRSKRSTVPIVWATSGTSSAWSKWYPVAIGDHGQKPVISLWPSNNETINGVAALQLTLTQKKFWVQKSTGEVFASIFWDQDGILFNDHLPKGQTINTKYYSSLLVQLKDIFKEKRRQREGHQGGLCTTMPWLTRHLQPRRNWPTWASKVLITHPILQIWPHRTTACSLDWKYNWKVTIFCLTWRSLQPRRPGWTDNFLLFLSGLQKLEQWAKCIELRGGYVE